MDHSRPPCRQELEAAGRDVLGGLGLPEIYLGWTMVVLASAFWREQVAAVPHARRLVLLPRCFRNVEACQAQMTTEGLDCRDCGACALTDLRAEALRQGYRVLLAEGSPAVLKIILGGQVDAVLGVACLDVLEKTFDKILLAGIPCLAVPLLSNGCRDTAADLDWVRQMLDTPHTAGARSAQSQTHTYLHLMRAAAGMFEPAELDRLVTAEDGKAPGLHPGDGPSPLARNESPGRSPGALLTGDEAARDALPPLVATEAMAREFLVAGGKHSRPFITLAVYDALTGSRGTRADGAEHVAGFSDAVKRIALAIEIFHKASLVHDDIEDDDWFRYGRPALHRRFGPAVAINVGDYLIGLGYRLVASQRDALGAEATADILAQFAQAHTKLCEGQGAELVWRDARDRQLSPLDALKICALKTAPAFEAALLSGVRLAGPVEPCREAACRFARHLGVAYQILNDLDDWEPGEASHRCGTDLLGGRPTVLWALALAGLGDAGRAKLLGLLAKPAADEATLAQAGELYRLSGAFRQATALVGKHHHRAGEAADALPPPLGRLFHFLADAILDRRPLSISEGTK
jgi:geranylgeranyl pyrophosphate synthase